MTSKNDTPETQIQLMMRRDSLDGDILRWEAARDKHAKRISEIDEVLYIGERPRMTDVAKLTRQIGLLKDDRFYPTEEEEAEDPIENLVAEELPLKEQELEKLHEEGESPLWSERLRLWEKIIHCSEEVFRCRDEAEKLDSQINPPDPSKQRVFAPWSQEQINRDMIESWDESDFIDYRDAKDVQIEELEFQIETMQMATDWETMSNERELRKKKDEIQRQQIQNLEEYIDQLEGLNENINPEWQKNVSLLDAQGDLIGKTIDVYFTGDHQKKSLALRYKEDLANRTKWEVTIKDKSGVNKYKVERQGKTYIMALGVNEKSNHVIVYSFMSKTSAWFQAYKDLSGPPSINQMTTYDLYQWHDKVEKHLQEKKARG